MSSPELFIGLMSGTSLDGVDGVIADFSAARPRLVAHHYLPFPPELRGSLLELHDSAESELHRAALTANQLTQLYAEVVRELLRVTAVAPESVLAIGCHGQTVRHNPAAGYTIQLNNPALLAELSGIAVVADFRSRDIAAGGQGAPLVPAFHHFVFHDSELHRVVLNIGGIANVTDLRSGQPPRGFDCGPGNVLLDAWIGARQGKTFDYDGAWAEQGRPAPALLARLRQHPFFDLEPPKSCGREQFNLPWLEQQLSGHEGAADVQATLLELTAASAADAITRWCGEPVEVLVCGGGARNRALVRRLAELLHPARVLTTEALGVDVNVVEALAFAWLARQALRREPGNLPAVTGARGPRVLGAIYPA